MSTEKPEREHQNDDAVNRTEEASGVRSETQEPAVETEASSQANQLGSAWPGSGQPGALCMTPGCRRSATRASGYKFCWWDDQTVSLDQKKAALVLGGKRGALSPADVAELLEDSPISTREGRHALRQRLFALRASDGLVSTKLRDLVALLDSASRDDAGKRDQPEAQEPLIVTVQKFSESVDSSSGNEGTVR